MSETVMIFAQDFSGVDAADISKRLDTIYGPVTVFHNVVLAREIVHPFKMPNGKMLMGYKSADELERYWPWVEGRWAIAGRHPSTPIIANPGDIAGRTVNARFVKNLKCTKTGRNNIRGILADLEVFDDRVPPDILRGMLEGTLKDVSIGYLHAKEMKPGRWNGSDYDFRQVNMFHDHTAFGIRKGRCHYPACGIGADSLLEAKCLNAACSNRELNDMESITVGHDPEETETNIEVPNPGVDAECKITATISISEEQGIQGRYCGEISEVRTFLFSKEKGWTMDKAKAWVDEQKESEGDALYKRLYAIAIGDQEGLVATVPISEDAKTMAYFDISVDIWSTLPELARTALIAAVPKGEEGAGADAMTEEELKAKIEEVQKQLDDLYATVPEEETEERAAYEILHAELTAYTEALTELIKAKAKLIEPAGDKPCDCVDEVARSKRLMGDHRLRHDPIRA